MRRRGPSGSVLVEGMGALVVSGLALALAGEVVRRVPLEIALHHGAFLRVRHRVLGLSDRESRHHVARWLMGSLGDAQARRVLSGLDATIIPHARLLEARLHYRFPQLLRFPWGKGEKHHFEVTKSCRFPY